MLNIRHVKGRFIGFYVRRGRVFKIVFDDLSQLYVFTMTRDCELDPDPAPTYDFTFMCYSDEYN